MVRANDYKIDDTVENLRLDPYAVNTALLFMVARPSLKYASVPTNSGEHTPHVPAVYLSFAFQAILAVSEDFRISSLAVINTPA